MDVLYLLVFTGASPSASENRGLFSPLNTDAGGARSGVSNKRLAGALEASINVVAGYKLRTREDESGLALQSPTAKLDPCLQKNSHYLIASPQHSSSEEPYKQETLQFKAAGFCLFVKKQLRVSSCGVAQSAQDESMMSDKRNECDDI